MMCVLPTLSWEPGIAVEAGWSAVGAAAAVEEELSWELQLSAGPGPEHIAAWMVEDKWMELI